ncbi:MAG: FMN-binding protein [Desulfobacterales bacterium]|nr:FMN-binding protein [Desulfobacterales bacterium]
MSDAMKSLLFAAAVGVVCSLLLTAASSGLKVFQQENALVDRQRNVLKSVGALDPKRKYGADEIKGLFATSIKDIRVDANGQVLAAEVETASGLPLFLYTRDGQVQSYIVPVDSRGLWGRIYGYLAIDNDGRTVTGFSVYQHSETPGLGGEIEKPWFQQNFVGRQIVDAQGNLTSVGIAKGKVAEVISPERKDHYVDGISGATLTGRYLSEGLKDIIKAYEPVSRRFRDEGRLELPETS